jgi:hypothetical protein
MERAGRVERRFRQPFRRDFFTQSGIQCAAYDGGIGGMVE